MEAGLVGTDHEIGERGHAAVGDHANRLARIERAEETRFAAEGIGDLRFGRESVLGQARQLRQLDLVDHVVAAHQRQHELLVAIGIAADDRDRLGGARERDAHQRGDVLAGLCVGVSMSRSCSAGAGRSPGDTASASSTLAA